MSNEYDDKLQREMGGLVADVLESLRIKCAPKMAMVVLSIAFAEVSCMVYNNENVLRVTEQLLKQAISVCMSKEEN